MQYSHISIEERRAPSVMFTHRSCEGVLHRGKEGSYVGFGGTFFFADLGTVEGERWTVEFLIPRGSERIVIDKNSVIISARFTPSGMETEVAYPTAGYTPAADAPEVHTLH